MRVGGLGVVDVVDAVERADALDAVRVGHEAAQPVAHGGGLDPGGAGQRGRRERVVDLVGRERRGVALDVGQRAQARPRRSAAR
ncbi:hypothetical protein GCM10025868_06710 [Angustibacter aerolatus]|uniref:Uncharacterized protein n=1 Tax=Angustibacter aerolatus TaxID=1162965 RepID=A0ABQ6JB66_9ACTN|nr:hypothetical protein GCM10025868_06710 [Angustibacter aerolatus]